MRGDTSKVYRPWTQVHTGWETDEKIHNNAGSDTNGNMHKSYTTGATQGGKHINAQNDERKTHKYAQGRHNGIVAQPMVGQIHKYTRREGGAKNAQAHTERNRRDQQTPTTGKCTITCRE